MFVSLQFCFIIIMADNTHSKGCLYRALTILVIVIVISIILSILSPFLLSVACALLLP